MLSQQDLPEYIEHEMPELAAICQREKPQNVYDIVRQMLKYTKSQLIRHNIQAAQQCMKLAEKLYYKGNNAIKNAIENVYVYSFSHAFLCDNNMDNEITHLIPAALYQLYKRQLIASHL